MSAEKSGSGPEEKTARAREALDRLEREAASRLPGWSSRGIDDPARALLESFAVVLGELRGELDESAARLLPRLLAKLGHEPLWPRAASSAVKLHGKRGLASAGKVPAGTAVTASRKEAGERRVYFETAADAWVSPANLEYAVVLEGAEARSLPVDEQGTAPTRLFGSDRLDHHLYLGDVEWNEVRRYSAELVLEWPGVPGALLEGEWEYSSGTGWRLLPVDFSQSVNTMGESLVRMRIHGPLPDMTSREIEGFEAPWIRLRLPAGGPVSLVTPTMVWSLRRDRKSKQKKPLGRTPERLFLHSGDSWQDHSFASDGALELAGLAPRSRPAVYLGWDRPESASLYWQSAGIEDGLDAELPRLDWEFSFEDSFRKLAADDQTGAFTRSGTVSWEAPGEWGRRRLFGRELYWVRASWSAGIYLSPALVDAVIPGGVEVVEGRLVGSQPATLQFTGSAAALPPHPEGDFEPFGSLSLSSSTAGGEGSWKTLRLQPGKSFPEPGRFCLRRMSDGGVEVLAGEVIEGPVKVRIEGLRTGIGRASAEFRGRLDVLEFEMDGLEGISNPVGILDGRGTESSRNFHRRLAVENSGGSAAVSGADYRRLLRAVEPGLSRLDVVPHPLRSTEVWVIAWGAAAEAGPRDCEPLGSQRLRALERYLQKRAPLGTVVHVVEALAIPFRLRLEVEGTLSSQRREELVAELSSVLREEFDPLTGGADGDGCSLVSAISAADFQALVGDVLFAVGDTRPLALRVESALGAGAVLDLPIAVPVLESIELEACRQEVPADPEGEGVK